MATPKLLLCGDVLGRLTQLFKRVSSVNKAAGPFDALLCVGQFFPDSPELLEEFNDYLEGRSVVPLPTYFIGDFGIGAQKTLSAASKNVCNKGFKMDGLKICEDLYWLKGSGKFTLHGLSVTYLSGKKSGSGSPFGTYSQDDIDALRALVEDPGVVDIFLSNEWPKGVTNRIAEADIPPGISDSAYNDSSVSELASEIKPRYHITATMGVYFDRPPYANPDATHVTRFIGLAPVGNKDKQKFIHAISPTPASTMSVSELCQKPQNTTVSPYLGMEKTATTNGATRRSSESDSDAQYWRYDVSKKRQKYGDGDGNKLCFKYVSSGSCPRGEQCYFHHDEDAREQSLRGVCFDFLNKGRCERGPDCSFKHGLQGEGESSSDRKSGPRSASSMRSRECWFCLSSPNVESHLVTSIGEHYYCALAKGPLVLDHVLIIPVEHSPTTLLLPSECESELSRYQRSLKTFFNKQGKEAVFFEWVFKRSTHANIQSVPIPSSKASAVQKIFTLAADKLGFEFQTLQVDNQYERRISLKSHLDPNSSLFYVELPSGVILFHVIKENEKFPSQFGREVLAGLLNMADRADWRNCQLSKDEEMKVVENFKKQFGEYDPSS